MAPTIDSRQALIRSFRENTNALGVELATKPAANTVYAGAKVNVGVEQVEAKAGASRAVGRQVLYIENSSAKTVWYGPTGVTPETGASLLPKQFVVLDIGDSIGVFLISDEADAFCVVQEYG